MSEPHWTWCKETVPFSALKEANQPAAFVVEQVSDKDFAIPMGAGFQYNPSDGSQPILVTRTTLETTDFASIPRYMSWLVSRHGRHTPAALVHDRLVVDKMPFEQRKRADRCFLVMLDSLQVPPVLSRVMWAAVSLATRLHGPAVAKAGMAAWAVTAVAGIATFVAGLVTATPWMIVLALLLPLVASLFWGRQFAAGVIAGYALPVVAVPAIGSLLGYWLYWLIETTVRLVRQRLRHNAGTELTSPIGYQGR
jgi:hypothetical protein